jgi:hypothetical protein
VLDELVKAGTKAMGGARFGLLNVLPSLLVVTVTGVLISAHAYDFDRSVDFSAMAPRKENLSTVVAFALAALVGGILLRPFERILVQQLEGYWTSPSPLAPLREAAVEGHRRRRDNAVMRIEDAERRPLMFPARASTLGELAAQERRIRRQARGAHRDKMIRRSYPNDKRYELRNKHRQLPASDLLPTRLGNVLRRAERMAGERYGLDAMTVYPRMYPYVSERLAEAMTRQLELITATASPAISFGLLSAATVPLIARLDLWSLSPFVAVALSALAYRGAAVAAAYTDVLFSTIFDLHRFDLAAAFHYPLPDDAAQEHALNVKLSSYLGSADPRALKDAALGAIRFKHPEATAPPTQPPVPPADGDPDSS